MKIAGLILATVAAWSSLAFAQAQQPVPATDAVAATGESQPMSSVTVRARRFHVEPQQFTNYEYAYNLSNGETVRFSRRVGRFYVAIRGYPTVEILPSGPAQFVSRGGATLLFTEGGDALTIDNYELLQGESGAPLVYAFGAPK
jgi:hypothetical protein